MCDGRLRLFPGEKAVGEERRPRCEGRGYSVLQYDDPAVEASAPGVILREQAPPANRLSLEAQDSGVSVPRYVEELPCYAYESILHLVATPGAFHGLGMDIDSIYSSSWNSSRARSQSGLEPPSEKPIGEGAHISSLA